VCGEEILYILEYNDYLGTPPRVWGRGYFDRKDWKYKGDTPTCVGKSLI